ncbi:hypothetical protein AVEN_224450-1 [Araneus ventricosus]|uniref:Uncharacterized protein n=1 Tax=Araneus ventricosus TaxID=182803 RepID=A0A4Y2S8H8_ARAVE|nr:hypothetical protein AVEN_224450-1 [Araneus ventricosus]
MPAGHSPLFLRDFWKAGRKNLRQCKWDIIPSTILKRKEKLVNTKRDISAVPPRFWKTGREKPIQSGHSPLFHFTFFGKQEGKTAIPMKLGRDHRCSTPRFWKTGRKTFRQYKAELYSLHNFGKQEGKTCKVQDIHLHSSMILKTGEKPSSM